MIDREKVIKGLTMCRAGHCDYRCPYVGINVGCKIRLKDDAIELLKEQEPVPAKIDGVSAGVKYGSCPNCGEGLNSEVYPHWCGFCGQAVTWND